MGKKTDTGLERLRSTFFVFGGLDNEIEKKLKSSAFGPEKEKRLLLDFIDLADLAPSESQRLVGLYDLLEPAYGGLGAPLFHPLRVTVSWLLHKGEATYERISLGLCHNIREIGRGRFNAIESEFLSNQVRQHIGILTIDRSRERDAGYLSGYYKNIDESGLMAFKGFDKLDNFLGFVRKNVDPFYYSVVDDLVCPSLNDPEPKLSQYLSRLSRYARDPEARQRFAVQTNT